MVQRATAAAKEAIAGSSVPAASPTGSPTGFPLSTSRLQVHRSTASQPVMSGSAAPASCLCSDNAQRHPSGEAMHELIDNLAKQNRDSAENYCNDWRNDGHRLPHGVQCPHLAVRQIQGLQGHCCIHRL